jgi:hypothetical protein
MSSGSEGTEGAVVVVVTGTVVVGWAEAGPAVVARGHHMAATNAAQQTVPTAAGRPDLINGLNRGATSLVPRPGHA